MPERRTAEPEVAHIARVQNYFASGSHHFAVDRQAAEEFEQRLPEVRMMTLEVRAFLRRALRVLGVHPNMRQFVDLGTGLPEGGCVHEIVESADPLRQQRPAKVVYVDNDPVVVAAGQDILAANGTTDRHRYIHGDFADPYLWCRVLDTGLIDPEQPVFLTLNSLLHFIPDADDPWARLDALKNQVAAGSMLLLSHGRRENPTTREQLAGETEVADEYTFSATAAYAKLIAPVMARPRDQIDRFFTGWEMFSPGLVYLPEWQPGAGDLQRFTREYGDPARSRLLGGVARKTAERMRPFLVN
ncbi:S-adenosyl methyltransferase [Tamaricihabitans halophyticus]|uniref:S-adenosyl methyltransferase n=1 Tax=Tamaricihabitans halophyticus TaxID=1262583 RepID=A0A4R2RB13_9PSEU|nr:SAM-dependent methyltransferase [Tamaricihabitans halophyticus]TCP56901.1 S-adenosyl methyltransferase [Tamaricihabitans halophyticus]